LLDQKLNYFYEKIKIKIKSKNIYHNIKIP
jgi:hypothetical protein